MSSSPEALEVLEAEVLKLAPADRSHLLERLVLQALIWTPKSRLPGSERRIAGSRAGVRRRRCDPRPRSDGRVAVKALSVTWSPAPRRRTDIADTLAFTGAGRPPRRKTLLQRIRARSQSPGRVPWLGHTHHERPKSLSVAGLSILGRLPGALENAIRIVVVRHQRRKPGYGGARR